MRKTSGLTFEILRAESPLQQACDRRSRRLSFRGSRAENGMSERPIDRDAILFSFHEACPRPSAGDVATWADRHPLLADDIRGHAEATLAVIQDAHLAPEPTPDLIDRTRRTAVAALQQARTLALRPTPVKDLSTLIAEAGTDVPRLARALGLGRAPLVDLVKGRVRLPVASAALLPIAEELQVSVETLASAVASARPTAAADYAGSAAPAAAGLRRHHQRRPDDVARPQGPLARPRRGGLSDGSAFRHQAAGASLPCGRVAHDGWRPIGCSHRQRGG